MGNKSDQFEKRKVSYDEAYEFAKNNKLEFTEVSALSASNIAEAFEIIARRVLKRLDTTSNPVQKLPPQKIANTQKDNEKSGGCC